MQNTNKNDIKDIYQLSPMQESMLFQHIMDKGSSAYFEQLSMDFTGKIDLIVFEKSVNTLLNRYDIFKTIFVYEKVKQPLQIVLKERGLKLITEDYSELKSEEQQKAVQAFIDRDKSRGFDLTSDVLVRISVLKLGKELHKVVWSHHHILMDGWCMGIIMKEFFQIYTSLAGNVPLNLPEVKPYNTYIKWLERQNKDNARTFWKKALEYYDTKTGVYTGRVSGKLDYALKNHSFYLDESATKKLQKIASDNHVTYNTVFQCMWAILLQNYNNTDDTVFGSVVSGRPSEIEGIEEMIGLFINTIPVRINADGVDTFSKLLKKVQAEALESDKYSYLPLAEVQAYSSLKQDLIDHIVVFENFPIEKDITEMDGDRLGLKIVNTDSYEQTNYNFNVIVGTGTEMFIKFSYNSAVYDEAVIQRLEDHFREIAAAVIANPDVLIKEIGLLTEAEKKTILVDFNQTGTVYPSEKTVDQLFEEQAGKTPNNIALIYENGQMTYREVLDRVGLLAGSLQNKGVKPGCVVGILTERSPEMVISILAILKAGGAYLPLDPEYPQERIEYILKDSFAKALLTRKRIIGDTVYDNLLFVDTPDAYTHEFNKDLVQNRKSSDLAYIIYTSGSTGKPKGVMIRHFSVVNILTALHSYYPLLPHDTYLLKTTYTFDVSVAELFGWFMQGGRLALLDPAEEKNPAGIIRAIRKYEVTHINFVPSMLKLLIDTMGAEDGKVLNRLKYLFTAGEALTVNLWKKVNRIADRVIFENIYGPTEITIYATRFSLKDPEGYSLTPIGKPVQNSRSYIIDRNNKLAPIGVPGELCISGDGLAAGYLNQPELTAEKFVDNPFETGKKMYRTGDLVRWLSDGNIEYLGRIDHQVKIRGFRIELGEIENRLLNQSDIKEAVVIAREDQEGSKYLCAYYMADHELTVAELREFLGHDLPDYMIPSYFVRMDKMPLTQSGKINRKVLPEPEGKIHSGQEYEAPRDEVEEKLCNIWAAILGLEKVGISDNFFELGGHSLKATIVVSRIIKELSVEIPLHEMFQSPTVKQLREFIKKAEGGLYSSIEPAGKREYYPLSSAQKRLFIVSGLDDSGISYNMPGAILIEGRLDEDRLNKTFQALIQRHETLRTSFIMLNGEPVQKVLDSAVFKIESIPNQETGIEKMMERFVRPFDLTQAPLLRVGLARINETSHVLVFDMHHIITDGTSIEVLVGEFAEIYNGKTLPELKIQYKDFAVWQNSVFTTEALYKQEDYWKTSLSGELPVLNLPVDYPRPLLQSFEGASLKFNIDKNLTSKLEKLALDTNSTLFMVLLAGYNVLLSKYSGQEDIVVGSPSAGRLHADLENIIGMFVNTLALRNFPESKKTFKELIRDVRESSLKAFENQDYQFEALLEKLDVRRDLGRNPLFDTMFALQNQGGKQTQAEGLTIKPYEQDRKTAKFDLYVEAVQSESGIELSFDYCVKLFKAETIERMGNNFINLLTALSMNPEAKLSDADYLSEKEKMKVLKEFNNTGSEYPRDKTLAELFEEQAKAVPGNIALMGPGKQLTYGELNKKANSLAHLLRKKGVGAESLVGIMTERSVETLVGILAILKAGGAYVPIDPAYPAERVKYMLEDAGVSIVVTQKALKEKFNLEQEIIDLDSPENYEESGANLKHVNKAQDLAYIIYTSGSTGKPKGVMIEHRNVVRLVKNTNYLTFDKDDRILQTGAIVFDASTLEFWGSLLNGLTLAIVDEDTILNAGKLGKALKEYSITTLWLTSPLFNQLAEQDASIFKGLKHLLVGGDVLSPVHINKVRKVCPDLQVINGYGPTENTTFSLTYNIKRDFEDRIPIGVPISNSTAYILGKNNELQPVGAWGELCVGGDGVGRGYLNQPELTKERFVSDPFIEGGRMYRTGDLARWLSDGSVEFGGRIDQQVKIRGFRIELGEIESRLSRYEGIREAVVTARGTESSSKYLCAYYSAEGSVDGTELREYLARELPDYMVPSYFVQLEKLPLNTNGKVDRKALPEPDGNMTLKSVYEAPRNDVEAKLASIWEAVLGIDKVGIHDNFFELGGHSLKATIVVSRVYKELNREMPLREVFNSPTVKEQAEYIQKAESGIYSSIGRAEERDYYPVSSAQKRLYVLSSLEGDGVGYNIPGVMVIEGSLKREAFDKALIELVKRHESFRTSFEMLGGEPVQRVHEKAELNILYAEIKEEEAGEWIGSFIRPFDLSEAPLLRVQLLKTGGNRHILMFDMHHIISDGTSMDILIGEFIELYQGKSLPELKFQYKDFAVWQNALFKTEHLKKQEEFWLKTFESELPVLNMPSDFIRQAVQTSEGANFEFSVGLDIRNKLSKLALETGTTLYMVLLAVYNVLLSKYSGQEDIIVGSPAAGRPHADLENIIGMFVNTLAMRNYPEGRKTFKEFLREVRDNSLKAFENQDYQYDELVEKLDVKRDLSRNPLFDTMFALQNTGTEKTEIGGLAVYPYVFENKTAKFDLSLDASEHDQGLDFTFEYSTNLFKPETIQKMSGHFVQLLNEAVQRPDTSILEMDMLTTEEKDRILHDFNHTNEAFPLNKTFIDLFEEQVLKTPEKTAVVFDNRIMTYKELNEKANQLARKLRKNEIGPDSVVGILTDRSLEMIVATLGVMKAGGAYLPIDPGYPKDRINYIVENSEAGVLLTQTAYEKEAGFTGTVINLDDTSIYSGDSSNPEKINQPEDLAYVIYTSGTTGLPKGVQVEQRNFVNISLAWRKVYGLDKMDVRLLQMASFSFDVFAGDLSRALLNGGQLIICPAETRYDPASLYELLTRYQINILESTPALVVPLMGYIHGKNLDISSLKLLIIGSDVCPVHEYKKICGWYGGSMRVLNSYGVTEATIDSSYYEDKSGTLPEFGNVPIGKPLANIEYYILNNGMKPQPVGVYGELYIGGAGVARGYRNNPELSRERFLENPYRSGKRLYKTGDIARWNDAGDVEFMGRVDNQVKVRGFRIELGEIEGWLSKHKDIRDITVAAQEDRDGQKYLCAYLTAGRDIPASELREYLANSLPDYMVPQYFVQLEKMPLTPNGKIDRKALPDPKVSIGRDKEYVAPRNETETRLIDVLKGVLGIDRIGINENFFELGGDSIKALQVAARLQNYGLQLDLKDLFRFPVIKELCHNHIVPLKRQSFQGVVEGNIPLTPIQRSFFDQAFKSESHYNQAIMLFKKDGFDEAILRRVFDAVTKHHDALRTVFNKESGAIIQTNLGNTHQAYSLDVIDLSHASNIEASVAENAEKIQAGMNLPEGPLFKIGLFRTTAGDHLLLAVHHLVVDGVSWRILLEDIESAYSQISTGRQVSLPPKTDSYKDWAETLMRYAQSGRLLKERAYWDGLDITGNRRLPRDFEIQESKYKDKIDLKVSLEADRTELLLKKANQAYHTEINDLLLTALGMAIKEWSGHDRVLISLEGHGREEISKGINISRTVGWFTSEYPVVLDVKGPDNLPKLIKTNKENFRKIPRKGVGYGILKYLTGQTGYDFKPEISFNYLGQLDQDINQGVIEMSPLFCGQSIGGENDDHITFDISGIVSDGKLTLSIVYNSGEYKEETVLSLLEGYKNALVRVIDHCAFREKSEVTPSDIGDNELSLENLALLTSKYGDNLQSCYTLSNMQAGMLFHSVLDKNSESYFEQMTFKIQGRFSPALFEQCFNKLAVQYDVLRTAFVYENMPEPHQVVLKERAYRVDYHDIGRMSEAEKAVFIENYKQRDRKKGFNLANDGLMRIAVLQTGHEQHEVVWSHHHILMDGWCNGLLMQDFLKIYEALEADKPVVLHEATPYRDYISWLRQQDKDEAEDFWKDYLNGYEQKSALPKLGNARHDDYLKKEYSFGLDQLTTASLEKMASAHSVTVNTIFQAIWAIILQKYNNTHDVVFGSVVSGRPSEISGIEKMVGLFINTVPVRINCANNPLFSELVRTEQEKAPDREKFGYLSLAEIQTCAEIKQDLLDHIIAFENFPVEKAVADSGQSGTGFSIEDIDTFEQTNYDLDIVVAIDGEMLVKFSYNGMVYDEAMMERLENHIREITKTVLADPDIRVNEIAMLSESEKTKLLKEFNNTGSEYPRDKTLAELFEEQVKEVPGNIALMGPGKQLTYGELNKKANSLAHLLRKKGVGAESLVGIMTERSVETLVGILAILKAGGAYVPIDPAYPAERVKYMLEDAGVSIVVTQKALKEKFSLEQEIIDLDSPENYEESGANLKHVNKAQDLAYIIYTSGSTGKPKGVMIEHRNIVRLVKNTNYLTFDKDDRILQTGAIVFDASTLEFWGSLINGLTLAIVDEDTILNAGKLGKALKEYGITTLWLTSPLFNQLAEQDALIFKGLKHLLVGGDVLSPVHINKVRKVCPDLQVINGYGPTENTTFSLTYNIQRDFEDRIPIGVPISNSTAYILGKNNELQPIGAWGELCVGGDGVGRGYLNQPELTKERFVSDPFIEGGRMYRTGDLARWLPDGSVEFGGRIDQQVKIRGFRIELGEIESRLSRYEGLREVVVTARGTESSSKYLCAYYSAEGSVEGTELREYLSRELPDYMVPSYFVQLEKLPLNTNGKVDRKALPEPDGNMTLKSVYEAPRNDVEAKLASIWEAVLGIDKVGIHDNFFELGGHSLKATIVVSRVYKELNVEMPLREVFNSPTVKEQAEYIQKAESGIYSSIGRAEERDYYPVSSAQKRLYVLSSLEGDGVGYNIPGVMVIEGGLKREAFDKALIELVKRHESFRTSFEMLDGEPVQRVHEKAELNILYAEIKEEEAGEWIGSFIRPFDLSKAPLLRVQLLKTGGNRHILMFDMHHIISDGTSMDILIGEFIELYQGKDLPELKFQYKDFAVWQNSQFKTEHLKKQEEFWLKTFEGELPVLNMPSDFIRPAVQSFEGEGSHVLLNAELTAKMEKLALETGTTLYMVLLAVYNVLLSKYSGQEDIIVGSPAAGRPHADLENIIGMFVNTLAMRNYPEGRKTFKEFLREVRDNSLKAFENQDYQFDELVEKLDLKRDLSRNPLFDTMFALQNMGGQLKQVAGLTIKPYEQGSKTSKFDLYLEAFKNGTEIDLNIDYSTRLFKRETIEKLAGHFVNLAGRLAEHPDVPLSEAEYLSPEERNTILLRYNDTKADYPREKTIHGLFEEQAAKTPDNIALIFDNGQMTYREVDEKTTRLAAYLKTKGVKTGSVVGVLIERSPEMVLGILGILKAGGAYLPLDPEYPNERIDYVLKDSGAVVLVTQTRYLDKAMIENKVALDDEEAYSPTGTVSLDSQMSSDNLAYIIYTSGSTGKPKGVMIRHFSAVNILTALHRYYPLLTKDTYLLKTTYTFDVSVAELFGWFMEGGRLAILGPSEEKNPLGIIQAIRKFQVTHINFVPSMLKMLLDTLDEKDAKDLNLLKYVFTAGEALSVNLWARFISIADRVAFENIYGPTELTIYATRYALKNPGGFFLTPIGKPVQNCRSYILDKYNKLVAIGVPGELCISGDGLAVGYMNQPELTAEKFVPNPFEKGERMYRTGDLVRWLPDGNIEYMGRIDHQVKIRGYRIELGEIENRLLRHPKIQEAVVAAREDENSNKYLCAYLIEEEELTVIELREYLGHDLPDYMIPSYFVRLEKMPQTQSGKIDRKALPEPVGNIHTGAVYEAPRNETEKILTEIWHGVLGVDKVSIHDSFFALGGDSIKALQTAARLQSHGLKMEIRDIFQSTTIAELSPHLKALVSSAYQGVVEGEAILTPIQQWFIHKGLSEMHHFNQSLFLYRKEGFEEADVRRVFDKICSHHDALRMVLKRDEGGYIQYNRGLDGELYSLRVEDLRQISEFEDKITAIAEEIQAGINLNEGPLVKLGLFKTVSGDHLLIVIHHLVIDGYSWRILMEDIMAAYEQLNSGIEIVLPAKSDSFQAWGESLLKYSQGKEIRSELAYWKRLESMDIGTLDKKRLNQGQIGKEYKDVSITLSAEHTDLLLKKAGQAYHTEINDLLLTGLVKAGEEWSGGRSLLINLEGHGREDIIPGLDISRTVGWFTSEFPVVLDIAESEDLSHQIKTIKESLRKIPNKGTGYGILNYLSPLEIKEGLRFNLKPEISFNYLGQFDQDINTEVIGVSSIHGGETISPFNERLFALDVNGMIGDGKLNLTCSFNGAEFNESDIISFMESYRENLIRIIDHCVQKENAEFTPHDFGDDQLSMEELNDIADILK